MNDYEKECVAMENEREREKLFEQMEKQSEEQKEHERKNVGASSLSLIGKSMQGLFQTMQNRLRPKTNIDAIEIPSDFPEVQEVQESESESKGESKDEISAENETAAPAELSKEARMEKIRDLQVALQSLNQCDKYAFIYLHLLNVGYLTSTEGADIVMQARELLREVGRKKWENHFFELAPHTFLVIEPDCRLNANSLLQICDEALQEFYQASLHPACEVCRHILLSERGKKPAQMLEIGQIQLARAVKQYANDHPQYQLSDKAVDMEALTSMLSDAIKENAIEQARRQFEIQLEENGELYDDEPVFIKTAEEMSVEEYESYLSIEQQQIKAAAKSTFIDDDVSVEQVLHNIRKHNTADDVLYLIAIASVDMNNLVLLEDIVDFEMLCEEQGIEMMQCSYIYAISQSGGHWYGTNHATKDIKDLFDTLSDVIVANGGRFQKELLYAVPNINIFKDIYFQ